MVVSFDMKYTNETLTSPEYIFIKNNTHVVIMKESLSPLPYDVTILFLCKYDYQYIWF